MLSQNKCKLVIPSVEDEIALRKLIISAKKGNSEAFAELYTKLFTPLYKYTFSRSHDVDTANDICQQAFLKFYQVLGTYEPTKSPLAYLFTIAKNLLINLQVKKTFIPFDEKLLETEADNTVEIMKDAHIRLLASSVNSYLPSLTQDESDMIRLYFYSQRQ